MGAGAWDSVRCSVFETLAAPPEMGASPAPAPTCALGTVCACGHSRARDTQQPPRRASLCSDLRRLGKGHLETKGKGLTCAQKSFSWPTLRRKMLLFPLRASALSAGFEPGTTLGLGGPALKEGGWWVSEQRTGRQGLLATGGLPPAPSATRHAPRPVPSGHAGSATPLPSPRLALRSSEKGSQEEPG